MSPILPPHIYKSWEWYINRKIKQSSSKYKTISIVFHLQIMFCVTLFNWLNTSILFFYLFQNMYICPIHWQLSVKATYNIGNISIVYIIIFYIIIYIVCKLSELSGWHILFSGHEKNIAVLCTAVKMFYFLPMINIRF